MARREGIPGRAADADRRARHPARAPGRLGRGRRDPARGDRRRRRAGRSDAPTRSAALAQLQALRGDAEGAERSLREVDAAMRERGRVDVDRPDRASPRADAALWDGRPAEARKVVAAELEPPRGDRRPRGCLSGAADRRRSARRGRSRRAARAPPGRPSALEQAIARRRRDPRRSASALIADEPQPEAALLVELAALEAARAAAERVGRGLGGARRPLGAITASAFPAAYCRWRAAELVLAGGGPRGDGLRDARRRPTAPRVRLARRAAAAGDHRSRPARPAPARGRRVGRRRRDRHGGSRRRPPTGSASPPVSSTSCG